MERKRKPDPEERARREAEFRKGQRELQARIDYHTAKLARSARATSAGGAGSGA